MIEFINIFEIKLSFIVNFLFTILSFKFLYHKVSFTDFIESCLIFLSAIKKMVLDNLCQKSNNIEFRNLEKCNQDKKKKNQNRKEGSGEF